MQEFLTTDEVAERYRTSPQTVRYWRHVGRGPASIKVGTRRLYAITELERYENELHASESSSVA